MVRPRSHATGENPFSRLQVADIGDVVASLYNVQVGVTARCAGGDIVPACCRVPAPPSLRSTPPSSLAAACLSPWAGTTSSPTPSCGRLPPRTAPSRSEEYIYISYGKYIFKVIHVDAHSDTAPSMMGERLAHGTPFRCAWEDGILDNKRVVQVGEILYAIEPEGHYRVISDLLLLHLRFYVFSQIGLRGTGWSHGDIGWGREQGWRVVQAEECWHK